MTRRRLIQEIDADELAHWMAKSRIDPFTPARADMNTNVLANLLVAINTPKGKQFTPRTYTPDYHARHRRQSETQTPEQMMAALVKANGMLGGTFE